MHDRFVLSTCISETQQDCKGDENVVAMQRQLDHRTILLSQSLIMYKEMLFTIS